MGMYKLTDVEKRRLVMLCTFEIDRLEERAIASEATSVSDLRWFFDDKKIYTNLISKIMQL